MQDMCVCVCVCVFSQLIWAGKFYGVVVEVAIPFFDKILFVLFFFFFMVLLLTHSAISHYKNLTAEFLVSLKATGPAYWLTFHQGGEGDVVSKKWMSRWVPSGEVAVGEPLADRIKV